MKVEIRYFSATGTTSKIVKALAEGMNCEILFLDITPFKNREEIIPIQCDLVVIAVPIYGEQIPRFIYDYLKQLDGKGKPLVALSVYGNVGYGFSLAQFTEFSHKNNFKLIGAGTFIGEHTYANEKIQVAYGRPDQSDLKQANTFGKQIREKYDSGDFEELILPTSNIPKFISSFPDAGTRFLIKQPVVDRKTCNQCGLCVKKCPANAIDLKSLLIDEKKCLRCYACVKWCPKSARIARFRFKLFQVIFKSIGGKRKENQIFL